MQPQSSPGLVLVAGASGYVGGRLVAALEAKGVPVRCLARRPAALRGRVRASTEVVRGDCLEPQSLGPALEGVHAAYYLVHSMGTPHDFAALDRKAARNFGEAAKTAGVSRIVYLGGLGDEAEELSDHLRSRRETGDLLRQSGVPLVELRASIVIGSGSLSYEMVRSLVERLPIMICPRWVEVKTQPIAIEDLIAYLLSALDLPAGVEGRFEIGGPDAVSYGDIMREYARQRGLRRLLIPVPLLTPRLSSLWLGLVTPLYARVGRKLIDSLRNRTVVGVPPPEGTFAIRPMGLREAIARALSLEDAEMAATRWCDAASSSLGAFAAAPRRAGNRLIDSRAVLVDVGPVAAFSPIERIGGKEGWYSSQILWRLRGMIDLLVGGVGLRRGRRPDGRIFQGDAIDFWRVEVYEPGRVLRLAAEMKLPGRAWLQFEVAPKPDGRSEIRQTAIFEPSGLAGLAYWYGLYPAHALIFHRMLAAIAAKAGTAAARQQGRAVS